ncbi:MAG TPA: hypothetical protein VHB25_02095 [Gemmatimonadaceae bacterium]|nr:hypothetical protein [Gemmatimonadaceae bacterium]
MMRFPSVPRWLSLAGAVVLAACGGSEISGPSHQPPAHIAAVSDLARSATVGSALTDAVVVRVTDAKGRAVEGATVAFAVTMGSGSTNPRLGTTDANGQATTTWTLGTVAGVNEVTASVSGVTSSVKFEAAGVPGDAVSLSVSPVSARLLSTVDTMRITARALDQFGNSTSPPPTFESRDPTLLSVDSSGFVRALRRGAATYVVAAAGAQQDSVLITVLSAGQSICTAAATPLDLAVGQVVANVSGDGFCVHASAANAEYAYIPYYNSIIGSSTARVDVLGYGVTAPPAPLALRRPSGVLTGGVPSLVPDDAFEQRLRSRERAEAAARLPAARSWMTANRDVVGVRAATSVAVPAVGDLLKYNVNAADFCGNPDLRTGRVVAVTQNAIVVADTLDPPGGFTDDEYKSIGVTFDTLITPVDTAAFGAPTDIDNNGHVILFFTRAVNELTPQGALSVVLGFFYARDLYPKTATSPGPCVGSNFAEMFYLMVPDTGGVVNGNRRSKQQVVSFTNGTVAHEFQHLINASRRMYVNKVGTQFEESWLDEGLSHTAEELNFFRASGRSPRTNLDASGYNDPKFAAAYSTFEQNNFLRYKNYLQRTETQAPIGFDATDDDLATRGAIWNFLRYAADHLPAGTEDAFWRRLVNTNLTGIANLTSALGFAPNDWFRDWAISVFLDDDAAGVDPLYQQPSWNLRSALTGGGVSTAFPLVTRSLSDGVVSSTTLAAGGVSFMRFSVPAGQDALLTATSAGQKLPASIQLAVVRVR